jgi:hypothetical protein
MWLCPYSKANMLNKTLPKSLLLLGFLFSFSSLFSQEQTVERPFEIGEREITIISLERPSVAENLVDFYQNVLQATSVSRCPFHTSCSYYAKEQVEAHGFVVGTLFFIDRYFYRENNGAYSLYPFKKNKDGVYKLDDDFYLQN